MASSSDAAPLSCIEEGAEARFSNAPEIRNPPISLSPQAADEGRDRKPHGQPSSIDHFKPPERPHIAGARRCSTVSVDYFDPEGVSTLSKSLDPARNEETHFSHSGPTASEDSEATLPGEVEQAFDFEQTLRHYLKKLVLFSYTSVLRLT